MKKYWQNDNHIAKYKCIKVTHCIPYVYTMLYVKYIN